jgi:hypothetical protein
LNNGKDYCDDDIEAMDWQKKTSLVQKDPVTWLTLSVIFFICIFFSLKNIFGTDWAALLSIDLNSHLTISLY